MDRVPVDQPTGRPYFQKRKGRPVSYCPPPPGRPFCFWKSGRPAGWLTDSLSILLVYYCYQWRFAPASATVPSSVLGLLFFYLCFSLSSFLPFSLSSLLPFFSFPFLLFGSLFRKFLGVLGDFGVPSGCLFGVFLKSLGVFGRLLVALGAAWGPKVDLGTHLGGKRGLE